MGQWMVLVCQSYVWVTGWCGSASPMYGSLDGVGLPLRCRRISTVCVFMHDGGRAERRPVARECAMSGDGVWLVALFLLN